MASCSFFGRLAAGCSRVLSLSRFLLRIANHPLKSETPLAHQFWLLLLPVHGTHGTRGSRGRGGGGCTPVVHGAVWLRLGWKALPHSPPRQRTVKVTSQMLEIPRPQPQGERARVETARTAFRFRAHFVRSIHARQKLGVQRARLSKSFA